MVDVIILCLFLTALSYLGIRLIIKILFLLSAMKHRIKTQTDLTWDVLLLSIITSVLLLYLFR